MDRTDYGQLKELFTLTFRARLAQKAYFKKPIGPKLINAKQHEKNLDEYLDKLRGQHTLFPTDPKDVETETHA